MIRYVANQPRLVKSLIMLIADIILLPLSLWTAIGLRIDVWTFPQTPAWWVYLLPPLVTIPIFIRLGMYRAVVRYMEDRVLLMITAAITLAVMIFVGLLNLLGQPQVPRGAVLIYSMIAVIYVGASRFLARAVLGHLLQLRSPLRRPVAIYGAGSAGRQLAVALRAGVEYQPVAFVDDSSAVQGLQILGLKVYSHEQLARVVLRRRVQVVLLALPSVTRARRIEIIRQLEPLRVEVRVVPGMSDVVGGDVQTLETREVEVDELLGRDVVPPNQVLLDANIKDKCVMVTGAGGSIGSELCRQITQQRPRTLLLYEQSEFGLYSIEQELLHLIARQHLSIELIPVLGSVQNETRLRDIMSRYAVQTVYHAAAYKHVPIVEFNMTEGIRNNTFGTQATAIAAIDANVETFVLISTDKAVRPTNLMGASKRFAELVLQSYAHDPAVKTRFCMVRFGNVLGSSGSVVPLFRRQIAAGGPVTVTHPDIIRYFMTIPEAAQLVIQAGAIGATGEVFVLDMGEPVRIVDLARRMIHLSGFSVRDEDDPDGDIEIRFAGLRPGEKLYEELLIGDDVAGTSHPKILMANEHYIERKQLEPHLETLVVACDRNDHDAIIRVMQACVSGFKPEAEIRDHLYAGNRSISPTLT
ncbi:NDP-sugar epimerase, includes UDP-GlcNAc-inverting 4,6-dehydratase FlaA1 and capsular polysaccharide biosynthesis protein EpsC [Paraburkholderia sartisoli]|uniref:NDP-sugar epimerase, includes UDP-GlcNAc-inverting 4,6-dehydratase FlaA1 and capsular polysaccharide biosynthesis protein EpsC n=2 Tax=Paraburkholderia sartisoli TaxID=83784 RepID=A0A1H4CPE4_9BURK|nr:NDP-sugar epimerase, includes UDP-GlcNAc-inverting 4,6-dehydratase FlaA1 and capsular polysaccharide biosynthesis protein EpsC [Paraburkholderia sartisoli]